MFEPTARQQRQEALLRLRELAVGVDDLRATVDAVGVVLLASLDAQRRLIELVGNPRATAGDELARSARSAAERGLWPEALADYDSAIATAWDQPQAHYGRAIAVLALAEEADGPIPVATVRDAAESFGKAVRYGRTTAQVVAARSALAAAALFDRVGEPDRADQVLRDAAGAIPGSPDLLFTAGRRLRSADLLDRAAKLDPTLVADPLWPDERFAAPVTAAVLERQRAAIAAGHRALASAAALVPMPTTTTGQPSTCVAALATLRELTAALDRAAEQLSPPTPHEVGLEQRRHSATAQLTSADVAYRRISVPVPLILLGIFALPFICVAGVLAEPIAAARGMDEVTGFGIGAAIAATVVAIGFAILVPISVARVRRQRRTRGGGVLAARGTAQALQAELQHRRGQREQALASIRAARAEAESLLQRAPIALRL
jgi:hypothetical protein